MGDGVFLSLLFYCRTAFKTNLTLMPTAFEMSSFAGGGRFRLTYGNHSRCTAIFSQLCIMQGSDVRNICWVFYFKKIGFVALAIEIITYRIFELRQISMRFVKKSHR